MGHNFPAFGVFENEPQICQFRLIYYFNVQRLTQFKIFYLYFYQNTNIKYQTLPKAYNTCL